MTRSLREKLPLEKSRGFLDLFFVLLLSLTLFGCEDQTVVTEVVADNGVLVVTAQGGSSFGSIGKGVTVEKIITLKNNGGYNLTKLGASILFSPLSYKGGSFPGVGGSCTDFLGSGESCNIVVEIYSEVKVELNYPFNIRYNDGVYNQYYEIPLQASIADVGSIIYGFGEFSSYEDLLDNVADPVIFPVTSVGLTATEIITLGNGGERNIEIMTEAFSTTDFAFTGGAFPGTNGTCTRSIAPQEICKIEISYFPSTSGNIIENLVVGFHNGASLDNGVLTFAGSAIFNYGDLTWTIFGDLDLGDIPQGFNYKTTVNVANAAIAEAVTVSGAITNNLGGLSFDGGTYPGDDGTCGATVPAVNICELDLSFQSNTLGAHAEVLTVFFNDNNVVGPLDKQIDLNIIANVVPPGDVTYDPVASIPTGDAANFPDVSIGSTLTHIIMLRNTGGFEIRALEVDLINNPSGKLQFIAGGSCGATKTVLDPNESCSVRVRTNSATIGDFTADIEIKYDDGLGGGIANQTKFVPVSSTFVDVSNVQIQGGSTYDLGEIQNGVTSPNFNVTIDNLSQGDATSFTLNLTNLASSDFVLQNNTCTATLSGLTSCVLTFNITPTSTGTKFTTIPITYSDALGPKNRTLSLIAESRNPANIIIRDENDVTLTDVNFQDAPVGQNSFKTIVIRNAGGLRATGINLSFTGTVFTLDDSGTCNAFSGFNLNGGDQCRIQVAFNPTSITTFNDFFDIAYHDGAAPANANYSAIGDGAASGLLQVTGAHAFNNFQVGQTVATVPLTTNLTFTNNGTADVTGIVLDPLVSTVFSYGTDNCTGQTINPAGTCTVELIYTPLVAGADLVDVAYSYNSSLNTKSFSFQVRGVGINPPDLNLSFIGPTQPASHNFGQTPILVTETLTININNTGQAAADNFSLLLDQGALSSYSILATDCPVGGSLSSGGACQVVISYSPEDEAVHNARLDVNYTGYGNETLPISVSFSAEGISPLSNFTAWTEIYSVSDDTNSEFRIKWDAMVTAVPGITVDGYKVYQSIGTPLPTTLEALAAYEVADIVGNTVLTREYSVTGASPDVAFYLAVRPKYLGRVMNTNDVPANLTIMTPPVNMALVHPYTVNRETCTLMGLPLDASQQLGCAYEGHGNTANFYKFNRILYVDRYEISLDGGNNPQNEPGVLPASYINQFAADFACKSFSFGYQGQGITKRLLTRKEWVAAASWPESLSIGLINSVEKDTGVNDCRVTATTPVATGSRPMCTSRYGISDMVGNFWEWNSDQMNGALGWNSGIDANSELFGLNMGVLFPDQITNQPCFSYIYGVSQAITVELCPNGVESSSITTILEDMIFPPVGTGLKAVRSGGAVGPVSSLTARKAGRWVGDFNTGISAIVGESGARCGFSLPFP